MRLSHIYHAWLPRPPKLPIIFDKDKRRTEASTLRYEIPSCSSFSTLDCNPLFGTDRNFDTNPKIGSAIETCGPSWQKLESTFEKYELSPPEVNRTIAGSPFCKHWHEVSTSPSSENPTAVDSGDQQSNRAVVQAFFFN
jgi:hypothetical protein